jgi:hypothetical protein
MSYQDSQPQGQGEPSAPVPASDVPEPAPSNPPSHEVPGGPVPPAPPVEPVGSVKGGGGGKGGDGGGDGGTSGGDRPPRPIPRGPWPDRVEFSTDRNGMPIAFRPREVITAQGPAALAIAQRVQPDDAPPVEVAGTVGPFTRLTNVADPLGLIEELHVEGIVSQPNHVYFSHSLHGSPAVGNTPPHRVRGNPAVGNPAVGNPAVGNPAVGNPAVGNPAVGNPGGGCGCNEPGYGEAGYGAPAYSHPAYSDQPFVNPYPPPPRSSALPLPEHSRTAALARRIHHPQAVGSPHVIVLDTGLAEAGHLPRALDMGAVTPATSQDTDKPDEDNDGYLDPCAGHGTFISGVIAQIAPGCEITHHRVLSTFGDGDEWTIVHCLEDLSLAEPERTILNLSFGAYVLDRPFCMAWAIRRVMATGAQVVSSAGNDATSRPQYPAATEGVIGVAAIGPYGPAPFTNWGPWVSACAPGANVVSTFFTRFDGPAEIDASGFDPDDFDGWAVWSGTSFAGPAVVGNLARIMMIEGINAGAAAHRVLGPSSLMRLPGLGMIVNYL